MNTLFLIVVALQIADSVTTYLALQQGGREANPLARKIFDKIGVVPGILALKVPITVAFYLLDLTPPMYGVLISAYGVAVIWNTKQLLNLRATKRAQPAG